MPDVCEMRDNRIAASSTTVFYRFNPQQWQKGQIVNMPAKGSTSAFGSARTYRGFDKSAVGADLSMKYLANVFSFLARKWEEDTRNVSSVHEMAKHPAYRAIVSFGPRVIPFIMDRIRSTTAFWFPALSEITGEDPVDPSDRGDFLAMQRAWTNWTIRNAGR
jgi:hypothetical protein